MPGDFNLEDIISTSDLQVWESAFDSTDLGDAHFDGNTDGIDFLIYQENFQLVNGALGGTVPEPATISFVTFLFGVFRASTHHCLLAPFTDVWTSSELVRLCADRRRDPESHRR